MRAGEFYSVICKIFALNFSGAVNEKIFNEIKKNQDWPLLNKSEANLKGRELYKAAMQGENLADIAADFEVLSRYFCATHFFAGDDERLRGLYKVCKFEPNLKSSKIDSVSNQFSFLAAVLRLESNKQTQEILGVFLSSYLLPYAKKLAPVLQSEAKSKFYRAFGYLLEDFANFLENSLEIKVVER